MERIEDIEQSLKFWQLMRDSYEESLEHANARIKVFEEKLAATGVDRRQATEDRRIAREVINTFTERRAAARRLSDRRPDAD